MNKDAQGRWKVGRSYIKLKMRAGIVRLSQADLHRRHDNHRYCNTVENNRWF